MALIIDKTYLEYVEVRVTGFPYGEQISTDITVLDVIDFFEACMDILLEDRGGNTDISSLWRLWIKKANNDSVSTLFTEEYYELGDARIVARVVSPNVLISLICEDSQLLVDPKVLVANEKAFVTQFRLSFKTVVARRADGLFECTSLQDMGKLVLLTTPTADSSVIPSILTVKNIKYICCAAAAAAAGSLSPIKATEVFTLPVIVAKPVTQHSAAVETAHSVFISSGGSTGAAKYNSVVTKQLKAAVATNTVCDATPQHRPVIQLDTTSSASIQSKLQRIPDCAERSLLALFHYFKYEYTNKKKGPFDPSLARSALVRLKEQLNMEDLTTQYIDSALVDLELNLDIKDADDLARCVWLCLNVIRCIDTDFLVDLLNENKRGAKFIEGKNIILLLGNCGAGKSTTIHFLGGSKIEMLENEETGEDYLSITSAAPQLMTFVAGRHCSRQTLFLNAVDLQVGDKTITLCDTPGFGDTRGVELDISNGFGVVNAIRGCKTARPLVLISQLAVGDRMDGMVDVLKAPTEMMSLIEPQLPSFSYWFTKFELHKYKNKPKLYKAANLRLDYITQNSNSDTAVFSVYQDMLDKIEARNEIAVVLDPTLDDPKALLQELLNTPAIENPAEVFRNFACAENLDKLKFQLIKHRMSVKNALDRQDYALVAYKLYQLRALSDCLQLEDTIWTYMSSVKQVSEFAEKLLHSIYNRIKSCIPDGAKSIESILSKSAQDICGLYKLDTLRAQHFPELASFPNYFSILVPRVQRELASTVQSFHDAVAANLTEFIQDKTHYDLDSMNSRLDKMVLLYTIFHDTFRGKEFDSVENADVCELLQSLVNSYTNARTMLKSIFNRLKLEIRIFLIKNQARSAIFCMVKFKLFTLTFGNHLNTDTTARCNAPT